MTQNQRRGLGRSGPLQDGGADKGDTVDITHKPTPREVAPESLVLDDTGSNGVHSSLPSSVLGKHIRFD